MRPVGLPVVSVVRALPNAPGCIGYVSSKKLPEQTTSFHKAPFEKVLWLRRSCGIISRRAKVVYSMVLLLSHLNFLVRSVSTLKRR